MHRIVNLPTHIYSLAVEVLNLNEVELTPVQCAYTRFANVIANNTSTMSSHWGIIRLIYDLSPRILGNDDISRGKGDGWLMNLHIRGIRTRISSLFQNGGIP